MKENSVDDDHSFPGRYDEANNTYSSDDFLMGTKTFFFILSIPFLMVLGKFLIVWDAGEFILSTFTCACIIGTILLGGRSDSKDFA
jgi:hypothetical protein